MRRRITLDEDTYEIVSMYSHAREITLGAAVGKLVRKAVAKPGSGQSRIKTAPNGLRVISGDGRVITSEMVKRFW
jgi:hypothetical protein